MAKLWKRKRPPREEKPFRERLKIAGKVLDDPTVDIIVRFINNKLLKSLDYPIAEGKESTVFRATAGENEVAKQFAKEFGNNFFAVKIFKYETSAFLHMSKYIEGDPRFKHAKHKKRPLVQQWAAKEFANLGEAFKAGAPVPRPVKRKQNVVVMQFIGTEEGRPYALLQQVVLQEPEKVLQKILEGILKLYQSGLVHADLSPYNILIRLGESGKEQPVFIDMGQAVLLQHPRAQKFLEHDVQTILNYFKKLGVEADFQEELDKIVGKS